MLTKALCEGVVPDSLRPGPSASIPGCSPPKKSSCSCPFSAARTKRSAHLSRTPPRMRSLPATWCSSGPAPIRSGRPPSWQSGRSGTMAESPALSCGRTAGAGETLGTRIGRLRCNSWGGLLSLSQLCACEAPAIGRLARVVTRLTGSRFSQRRGGNCALSLNLERAENSGSCRARKVDIIFGNSSSKYCAYPDGAKNGPVPLHDSRSP